MTAEIIAFLAFSVLPLSPPDVIQRIPPKIKNIKANTTARKRRNVTIFAIKGELSSIGLHRDEKDLVGQVGTAKTGVAMKLKTEVIRASTANIFFAFEFILMNIQLKSQCHDYKIHRGSSILNR